MKVAAFSSAYEVFDVGGYDALEGAGAGVVGVVARDGVEGGLWVVL